MLLYTSRGSDFNFSEGLKISRKHCLHGIFSPSEKLKPEPREV